MNEKKVIKYILKKLARAYPSNYLGIKNRENFDKIFKKNEHAVQSLYRIGFLEKDKELVPRIEGTGEEINGKVVFKKYSKKILAESPIYINLPIISEKGFSYLQLRAQRKMNNLIIILTGLTVLLGVLEFL